MEEEAQEDQLPFGLNLVLIFVIYISLLYLRKMLSFVFIFLLSHTTIRLIAIQVGMDHKGNKAPQGHFGGIQIPLQLSSAFQLSGFF